MKLNAKSISSPARTEKFPPPLMRFLRTNAASRSRRSRSSPMFVLRKKTNTTIETTQEPSSPKVTCMGQVRAKRSSKSKSKSKPKSTQTHNWWIKKPNPCRCPRPIWPKWNFFKRKQTKQHKQDSVKSESNSTTFPLDEEEDKVSVIVDNAFATASNSTTPPKNALLLTRCRSAPYRSSSLASKFWSSPLRNDETESISVDDNEKSSLQSMYRESVSDKEDSVGERISESRDLENVEELKENKEEDESTVAMAVARPVLLTRCKSEPARIGCRIEPEVNNLWKKSRLGFTVNSSPQHILSD